MAREQQTGCKEHGEKHADAQHHAVPDYAVVEARLPECGNENPLRRAERQVTEWAAPEYGTSTAFPGSQATTANNSRKQSGTIATLSVTDE